MADQTSIQESAQAIFCAIADFIGEAKLDKFFDIKEFPTYGLFKKNIEKSFNITIADVFRKHVEAPKVTLREIEDLFVSDVRWYYSSVNIAKKVVEEIDSINKSFSKVKRPNWSDLLYVRGDEETMKNLQEMFKIANKTNQKLNETITGKKLIVFGDVNKWNPADIYFSSTQAQQQIKDVLHSARAEKSLTFRELNALVFQMIKSGELLPLSLKKAAKEVHIEKVNFDRALEKEKILQFGCVRVSDWKPWSVKNQETRDFKIYIDKSDPKLYLQFRHDPSTPTLKFELVRAGESYKMGSISSIEQLASIIDTLDASFSGKITTMFRLQDKAFKEQVGTKDMLLLKTKNRSKFDDERTELSATLITNVVNPKLIAWLKADKNRADAFVRMAYTYVTARSEISSPFVIAK